MNLTASSDSPLIIVVDDERDIAKLIDHHLTQDGFRVKCYETGKDGLAAIQQEKAALIILDVMLPGMNGFDVCRQLRALSINTPVLFLTAKADEIDRVLGLELGGDDYVTKPFSVRELSARIKVILKRSAPPVENAARTFSAGPVAIDMGRRLATLRDKPIELTATEFDLLACLVERKGRPLSRQDLLSLVWGYNFEGYEQTVSTHINRLRNKIEKDPSKPILIETVWGIGYRFLEAHADS